MQNLKIHFEIKTCREPILVRHTLALVDVLQFYLPTYLPTYLSTYLHYLMLQDCHHSQLYLEFHSYDDINVRSFTLQPFLKMGHPGVFSFIFVLYKPFYRIKL